VVVYEGYSPLCDEVLEFVCVGVTFKDKVFRMGCHAPFAQTCLVERRQNARVGCRETAHFSQ
jgi:hypothetical protein